MSRQVIALAAAVLLIPWPAEARTCTHQSEINLRRCEALMSGRPLNRRLDCTYEMDKRLKGCLETGLWPTKAQAGKTFDKR